MKYRSGLFMLFVVIAILALTACGAAATQAPAGTIFVEEAAATEPPATEAPFFAEEQAAKEGASVAQDQALEQAPLAPMPTAAAYEVSNAAGDLTVIERSNRMIIKNADVRLMVKDTDVAIDRATQIIGDAGGYIVSSRVWYQDYYGNNLKYAAITIGVPVDEFERALVKLRDLAVRVVDEVASGDDVTEQYVDLQSQLTNLEATRARIQEFLTDAKTVDEALRINQELANIESQIEQIKGRMNYLSDRSSYSTITINLERKSAPAVGITQAVYPVAQEVKPALLLFTSGTTSLPKGAVHLNMATVSMGIARELASVHQDAYVSAPVFGRPPLAAQGQLDIIERHIRLDDDRIEKHLHAKRDGDRCEHDISPGEVEPEKPVEYP